MLISEEYKEQNRLLHENRNYGVAGKAYSRMVDKISLDFSCETILDYGCGKGQLSMVLPHLKIDQYDPAIEEYSGTPEPSDFVVCLDVMEHIEPEYLENVLDHLKELTKKVALISVSTRLAHKNLPDGRNAHLIVEQPEWWLPKFLSRWRLFTFQRGEDYFYMILVP